MLVLGNNGNGKGNWSSIDPQLIDPTGQLHEGVTMPGWDGLPFKGPVPDLKESDVRQPEVAMKVHVEIFELWNKKHLKRYREICQVIANGFGQISKEDMQYDARNKGWRVLIRWVELFTAMRRGNSHGHTG